MGYYQGDYYMAGPPVVPTGIAPGASKFGAFFKNVDWGKVAGTAAQVGSLFLPGAVGAAARGAASLIPSGTPGGLGALAAAGGGRRYRRMNVTNVRALRRSMRRVQGFAKLARRTVSFTQRVKMKKRGRR